MSNSLEQVKTLEAKVAGIIVLNEKLLKEKKALETETRAFADRNKDLEGMNTQLLDQCKAVEAMNKELLEELKKTKAKADELEAQNKVWAEESKSIEQSFHNMFTLLNRYEDSINGDAASGEAVPAVPSADSEAAPAEGAPSAVVEAAPAAASPVPDDVPTADADAALQAIEAVSSDEADADPFLEDGLFGGGESADKASNGELDIF